METTRQRDGTTRYVDAQGTMETHELGPGVLLHVRRGVMNAALAECVRAECDRQYAKAKRLVLMVDALETKMHTTEFRDVMTRWFKEHPSAYVHMLVASPMLRMAVDVANLTMGEERAKTYPDVASWEAVGRTEVKGFARRPHAGA